MSMKHLTSSSSRLYFSLNISCLIKRQTVQCEVTPPISFSFSYSTLWFSHRLI